MAQYPFGTMCEESALLCIHAAERKQIIPSIVQQGLLEPLLPLYTFKFASVNTKWGDADTHATCPMTD